MREQMSKEWSLVLFKKIENNYFEELEETKFKFGRTQDEVLENEGEKMSEGLISIVKSKNLQEDAMETGFVIIFTTNDPKSDDYILLNKLISSPGKRRKFGYSLYSVENENYPLRFVDLGDPNTNPPMPNKIWLSLRPLTINEISWGIGNKIFGDLENDNFKGEQMRLTDFGFGVQKNKKAKEIGVGYTPDLPLPGPSDFKYKFLN